jgi:hypothetical protein
MRDEALIKLIQKQSLSSDYTFVITEGEVTWNIIAEGSDTAIKAEQEPSGFVLPSEAEITAEVARLQTEYDSQQYSRDRAVAYPPMADQLDDIFHNGVAGWKKTIQAVKDTYPKP